MLAVLQVLATILRGYYDVVLLVVPKLAVDFDAPTTTTLSSLLSASHPLITLNETKSANQRLVATELPLSTPCQQVYNTSTLRDQCQANFVDRGNGCQRLSNEAENKLWKRYQAELAAATAVTQNTTTTTTISSSCKTIWITGMGLGYGKIINNTSGDKSYKSMYAAAFASAKAQGLLETLLQPVVVLLTPPPPPLPNGDDTSSRNTTFSQQKQRQRQSIDKFIAWLESQNVVAIQVHSISFQDLVLQAYPHYAFNGALSYYLRFDFAKILRQHRDKLLANRGDVTCPNDDDDKVVFYTDNDVLFVNPIPPAEFHYLKSKTTRQHFLMYGQDYLMHRPKPSNTGVMWMHLDGFDAAWEDRIKPWGAALIQQHSLQQNGTVVVVQDPIPTGGNDDWWFPPHDQLWLNFYYIQPKIWRPENLLLPPTWNWKVYWEMELDDSSKDDSTTIYIVHFHGPKPDKGVDEMAVCDLDAMTIPRNKSYHFPPGHQLFEASSMCCDHGRTAHRVLNLYEQWRPTEAQMTQWW